MPYFKTNSPQKIQIGHAWHLLRAAGKLDQNYNAFTNSRVNVSIVDTGFHSGADLLDPQISGTESAPTPRGINMSFSIQVPTLTSFTVGPIESAILTLASHGSLVIASAPNGGDNIDEVSCVVGSGTPCCDIVWEINGTENSELTGALVNLPDLVAGTHVITVTETDSAG